MDSRSEIRGFLASRRARITPERAGLRGSAVADADYRIWVYRAAAGLLVDPMDVGRVSSHSA